MATPAELEAANSIAREREERSEIRNKIKRGSGESLGSLEKNAGFNLTPAEKESGTGNRRNWRDTLREKLGILAPQTNKIDFSTRTINDDGLVETNWKDSLYGVSQPELQYEYEQKRRGKLDTSVDGQEYETTFGVKPSSTIEKFAGSRINEADLRSLTKTEKTKRTNVKDAFKALSDMEVEGEGLSLKTKALAELRANPDVTSDEIIAITSGLKKYNPDEILVRAGTAASTGLTEAQTSEVGDRLELDRTKERNTNNNESRKVSILEADQINKQLQQEWANNDATSLREHEASQLAAKLAHEASENDATRNIKMQIEMLGREDNREQRSYDRRRDERQDRQMMIMQMMKGLQQLGGGFSI